MDKIYSLFFKWLLCSIVIFILFLAGCAQNDGKYYDIKKIARQGISELKQKRYPEARKYFAIGLRHDPRNCQLNFLNGLSYQLEGKGDNYKLLNLAKSGYKTAISYCPQEPWPYYFYGVIALQQGDYILADKLFKQAEANNPDKSTTLFLKGYLYSAYRCGDVKGAKQALQELKAARVDDPLVEKLGKFFTQVETPQENKLLKKTALHKTFRHNKKQVVVDGVIILSREIANSNRGLNLLSGLKLKYNGNYTNSHTSVGSSWERIVDDLQGKGIDASAATPPFTNEVVHQLSINDLTYDLDIFDDADEQNEVLARPSLVVENGQEAKYFSGSELLFGLNGVESSTIEKLPVGIILNVTPTFEDDDTINMKIEIGREALVNNTELTTSTSFDETAEVLRERTETTVNLHFGETVILSALSSAAEADTSDRTPFLGHVPILDNLFNRRQKQRIKTNFLILLTPQKYVSFDSEFKSPSYADLLKYYSRLVDPTTNLRDTLRNLSKIHIYYFPDKLTPVLYDQPGIEKAIQENYQGISSNWK